MNSFAVCLLFTLLTFTISSAIPKPEDKEKRVHEKPDLSKTEHFDESEGHNAEYDHDAFLGEEEARTFDDLSPEESKEKLKLIYDKIDTDKDGFVTEEELTKWIKHVQNRYVIDDTERQWKEYEPKDDKLQWNDYITRTYGTEEEGSEFNDMQKRDKRRWEKADLDQDGVLTKDEYQNFLHPEDSEHMKEVVVDETLEDIDKDKDGFITLEEYIGDMWPNKDEGEEEPDWVKNEREQFSSYRDHDNDGKMNRAEVRDWILPDDYDHAAAESKHLVQESDADKDEKLTKEEVIEKYDLFVGSQATDFGEALTRHDEF